MNIHRKLSIIWLPGHSTVPIKRINLNTWIWIVIWQDIGKTNLGYIFKWKVKRLRSMLSPLYSKTVHILTGNDVTSCFRLAANHDNMRRVLVNMSCDFLINAKTFAKISTVLERRIQMLHFVLCKLFDSFARWPWKLGQRETAVIDASLFSNSQFTVLVNHQTGLENVGSFGIRDSSKSFFVVQFWP